MMRLEQAVAAWGTPEFESVLKREIAQSGAAHLPLQQGLQAGNYLADMPISAMLIRVIDSGATIRVDAGIFYQGILSGCSCADDPTPLSLSNEYCEVRLEIDKSTANATVEMAQ